MLCNVDWLGQLRKGSGQKKSAHCDIYNSFLHVISSLSTVSRSTYLSQLQP